MLPADTPSSTTLEALPAPDPPSGAPNQIFIPLQYPVCSLNNPRSCFFLQVTCSYTLLPRLSHISSHPLSRPPTSNFLPASVTL